MFILGLTGPIASGKSTTAEYLRSLGAYVIDADAIVHRMYQAGTEHTMYIQSLTPAPVLDSDGSIDRQKLRQEIARFPELLEKIESYIHPQLKKIYKTYITQNIKKYSVFVLDVPLLFQAGTDDLCDAVMVCSCPLDVRRARALRREGMTQESFDMIASKQMPQESYDAQGDYIISSDAAKEEMFSDIGNVFHLVQGLSGDKWERLWGNI